MISFIAYIRFNHYFCNQKREHSAQVITLTTNKNNMEISSQFPFGKVTTTVDDSIVDAIAKEVTKKVISNVVAVFNNAISEDNVLEMARDLVRQQMTGQVSLPSPAVSVSSTPNAKPSSVTSAPVHSTPTSSSEETKEETPEFPFDLKKVVGYIMDSIKLVQSGEDCTEVSDILRSDVLKETRDLVDICLRSTKHGIKVYMHNIPQVVALHPARWSGLENPDKVEASLLKAFSGKYSVDDSTTPLSGKHRDVKRPSGYSQGSYKRIKRGSGQMRCRCHRNSDQLAPMVIDPEIGEFLYNNGFTHVALSYGIKDMGSKYEVNEDRLKLIFTKEDIPTRAPRLSATISRLHPYGNGKEGKVSTYCLGSDTFNRSILNHFNQSCKGLEERVFQIKQTGSEKNGKIGYEITSVVTA